jgi:hypothetical protein
MWVFLRLLTAAIVGVVRFQRRQTGVDGYRSTGEIRWVYRQQKNKHRVVSTSFGLAIEHPVFLRLSHEGVIDRFFKAMGLAREFQTGAQTFDDRVYVTCDHPAIETLLQEDDDVRHGILDLLQRDVGYLYTDGAYVWARRRGDAMPNEAELVQLEKIRAGLASIPAESFRVLRDPFLWRALVVESIAWSLACYGFPVFLEMLSRPEPLYFDWGPLVRIGLWVALGIFITLTTLSWLLLRGSSRAHRVFVGSFLLLTIGVPLSSVEMVSDANIALDQSEAIVMRVTVEGKYTTVTRGRRGRKRTKYYLNIRPPSDAPVPLPQHVQVPSTTYRQVGEHSEVTITLHRGRFNFPWVKSILPAR